MNELLQQRIESVQAGRNTTHAQIEAKRSLREQLDSDLEPFLKKSRKGGDFATRLFGIKR